MTDTGRKKGFSILDFIERAVSKFPTDTERKELLESLDILIKYFQNMQGKIRSLPQDMEQREVLSAIATMRNFLESARDKPLLAAAFGLPYRKNALAREAKEEVAPVVAEKIFDELKMLSTEEIQQRLLDYKTTSMDQLHALATYLNIKHPQRMRRQDLIDKIVKVGFANVRAYDTLRTAKD
jgi:DNA mismatch repair ATPase MutL